MMKDIGKKWRENRLRLFNTYYDMTKSREENIRTPPKSILATEWASFIDYRLKESTKVYFVHFSNGLIIIMELICFFLMFTEYMSKEC